ncbi:MAG TPA: homogentisate 1,2-dioxygenase [Gammaproteobacteria bacterium]|nr:homogentisate 1,2-dioxygenase [Gammaproteobacteria bacterium]HBF08309.1 homogentisate 1,2-dioxygenase [Gammaproteobacteria bacterium]HCK94114.1 homogentisate 1,2-dioxygenase [Gammaproteobacteria bacterium]|tara:strand:+ start:3234 stop:4427 length:1194 start_codon:yes stop_codon:yes gene_type:complete
MSTTKPLGDRRSEGLTQRQAHADLPDNTYEREMGRKGFFGQSTHMYHQHPPTGWIDWKGPLRPRAFNCNHLQPSENLTGNDDIVLDNSPFAACLLLHNKDTQVHFWSIERAMTKICRNADGDWLLFIHQGIGQLYCDYGHMSLEKGDYIVLPKGTLWRLSPDSEMKILCIEATEARYELPDKGILGPHAIFDPALLETPQINEAFKKQYAALLTKDPVYQVIVKRNNEYSQITYPFNPLDAVGWHGDLMPTKINIKQIRPVMSHRYHLPPSVHSTFVAPGFVVCTFVPRPFETDEDALKIPFFHNNDDYDEVIFYHEGDFFSRDHIEPGMITFHPAGFSHGPHPKALKNMLKQTKTGTSEYAVMIDSRFPLKTTQAASAVEDIAYVRSWQNPGEEKK